MGGVGDVLVVEKVEDYQGTASQPKYHRLFQGNLHHFLP